MLCWPVPGSVLRAHFLVLAVALSPAARGGEEGTDAVSSGMEDTSINLVEFQRAQGIYNVSQEGLLRGVQEKIMLGFMPPFLARELYSCGAGSPKEPIIEGWGRDIMSETSQEPLLISEMSKDHRGEVVYSETRWFFSKRGRDDFAFALKTYGISAATHAGKHDALVLLGAHKSDWEESLLPRKAGHGLYGLRYAVAARVSAQLAEKPRLTNDAVSALRKIQAAYTVGDSALARKLILDFFRAHGTHYLPGPFRFGGLLFAVTLDPPVGMEDVDLRGQREKTDKVFGAEFAKYGVDIRCGEGHTWNLGSDAKFVQDSVGTRRDGGETGDSGHEGIIFRVGNFTHVAGGITPSLVGSKWLQSVTWGTTPTNAWGLIDRGHPRPVWELVHKSRDPFLTAWLVQEMQDSYVDVLRRVNREVLHNAALAGARPEVKLLVSSGLQVEGQDAEGRTPLHVAVEAGNLQTVKQLVQNGAMPGALLHPIRKTTELHIAAEGGHAAICDVLLQSGADVHARDSEGKTAADVARGTSSMESFKVLQIHADNKDYEL